MQLDVRGAAAMLNVGESTVYKWIAERNLPARGVQGQYRFGRTELLEWATAHKINVSQDLFDEDQASHQDLLVLPALEAGGIHYHVVGGDKPSALQAVVDCIPLPQGCDAAMLLQLFLAREAVGSTAVGGGVAIPHPRHPVVLPVKSAQLSICFLEQPIDFGAPNGEGVHTLFVLLSPTVHVHLQMLARVAALLRDDRFRQVLAARKSAREILNEVRRVEEGFGPAQPRRESPS